MRYYIYYKNNCVTTHMTSTPEDEFIQAIISSDPDVVKIVRKKDDVTVWQKPE